MITKDVPAKDLRVGDETLYHSKPGSTAKQRVRVAKVLSIPTNRCVEVRWVDILTEKIVFEGLYRHAESVTILKV